MSDNIKKIAPQTPIEGDLEVGRNVIVGGKMKVNGNMTLEQGIRVKGSVMIDNLNLPTVGVFNDETELNTYMPTPKSGLIAGVLYTSDNVTKVKIYLSYGAAWNDTGGTMDVRTVWHTTSDDVPSEVVINQLSRQVENLSSDVSNVLYGFDELKELYQALTQSDIVVVEDHTDVSEPATNTIYREQGESSYSDWMYYNGAWEKMAEYDNAIDEEPTPGSDNLVKSGGVKSYLDNNYGKWTEKPEYIQVITDYDGKILEGIKTDGTKEINIPTTFKSVGTLHITGDSTLGGHLSVKGNIDTPSNTQQSIKNTEYIYVTTDLEKKIIEGIKIDGTKHIVCGLQVDGEITNKGLQEKLDAKANVSDLETKIDKITNGVDNTETLSFLKPIYNPEWVQATIDSEGRVISYRRTDGVKAENVGIITPTIYARNINLSNEGINKLKKEVCPIDYLNIILNMPIPHPLDSNGKEKSIEIPVYNVERKAKQFRDIEWEALSPIPKNANVGGFYEGNMIGLPYASCLEIDKIVGYDISFVTFMTAANNPYSMLYTENLRDNGSVYGFTYHTGRPTIAGWAGVVCNIMETFSTGMLIPWDTSLWSYLEKKGLLVKVYDQSAQGVRIGDFLWQEGHGRMVQNIWRDSNGLVEKIECSTGGMHDAEYMFETPEAFDEDLAQRNGIIYRNSKLYNNIVFKDIPFTLYGGETKEYDYNDDICTFAGDYACFREGFRIVLNYNLKEDKTWESVELYKNDVLFGTYNLADDIGVYSRGPENYPEEKAELVPSHSFDLSFLNLTYGKYKARLFDGNVGYSDYTYFEILETNVSYSKNSDGSVRILFQSNNGDPFYLRISRANGGPKAIYPFTENEINNGFCDVDIIDLIQEQDGNFSAGENLLKVYFKGDYGCVTNEPVEIII